MITIRITDEQREALNRPVGRYTQRGGFQRLIDDIQDGIKRAPDGGGWTLTISQTNAERVEKYAYDYGEGTYQSQLRAILPQIRAALAEIHAKQPGLFEEQISA